MKGVRVVNAYVDDLEGVFQYLKNNDFKIISVSSDGFSTSAYFHDVEQKDPTKIVTEWANKDFRKGVTRKLEYRVFPKAEMRAQSSISPQNSQIECHVPVEIPGVLFENKDIVQEASISIVKKRSLLERLKTFFIGLLR